MRCGWIPTVAEMTEEAGFPEGIGIESSHGLDARQALL